MPVHLLDTYNKRVGEVPCCIVKRGRILPGVVEMSTMAACLVHS